MLIKNQLFIKAGFQPISLIVNLESTLRIKITLGNVVGNVAISAHSPWFNGTINFLGSRATADIMHSPTNFHFHLDMDPFIWSLSSNAGVVVTTAANDPSLLLKAPVRTQLSALQDRHLALLFTGPGALFPVWFVTRMFATCIFSSLDPSMFLMFVSFITMMCSSVSPTVQHTGPACCTHDKRVVLFFYRVFKFRMTVKYTTFEI
eukprot:TRINITY_DN375_c0_g3_i4.p1 TRINITY_DN375_c0_g3~~TRINITY_DN375_c0_g3_i4.p1  ORF type:complete len:205 (-),score=17.13 TRINITY_DN375_c0_g3_i4:269-883(-)